MEKHERGAEKIKEQFILTERLEKPLPTPVWVKPRLDKRFEEALEAAAWAYRTTGRWFFVPSGDNPYTGIRIRRWDECETASVYGRLLERLRLEELPNYSEKNRREAITWWQSWQNSGTGRFYNPLYVDPQEPERKRREDSVYDEYASNEKYIPGVLTLLGAEPLYPVQLHGKAKVGLFDYDAMLHCIEVEKIYNHGGKMLNDLLCRIDKEESEGIPFAEYAIAFAVDWIHPETGIIAGPGRDWGEYGSLEPTLKTFGRMIGQQGIENLPPAKMRAFADFVIERQPDFVSLRQAGNIRNTAELMLLAMAVSDYRKGEIMQALINHSKSLEDPELWKNTGYPAYACSLIGGMIWWRTFPPHQAAGPILGGWFGHRILMGPFHRWANLIPKRPEEFGENPEYDFKRYGLKYRNREHWARRVDEIIPTLSESGEHWRFSTRPVPKDWTDRDFDDSEWETGKPPQGAKEHLFLRRSFVLDERSLEFPWLRADWNGSFKVFVNGFPVKSTIRRWKKAGWYLPDEVRASLKPGKNTVAVESVRNDPSSFIDIGLIDWRLG